MSECSRYALFAFCVAGGLLMSPDLGYAQATSSSSNLPIANEPGRTEETQSADPATASEVDREAPASRSERANARKLVSEGNALFEAEKLREALDAYLAAREKLPDAKEIDFNTGLGHLRLKEYDKARAAFEKAAYGEDRKLADDAMFARAAADHLQALEQGDDPQAAISSFERAMRGYQDVLGANPGHAAAREANYKAGTVWRQLKEIQQQQQQDQQQNDNQEQQDPQQDQQQSQQNQQQQDQSSERQESQQNQDQQQRDQAQETERQQAPQGEDEQQPQATPQQAEPNEESLEQALRQLRQLIDEMRRRKQDRVEYVPAQPAPRNEKKDW